MKHCPSISENNGIAILENKDQKIYSVGISTGGVAEMRMVKDHPNRTVIATTIDPIGETFARVQIENAELSSQIQVKIEDITKPLPYPNAHFDYIYARLVLHYLPKKDLQYALSELTRVLKHNGKIFVVVRSVDCPEAKSEGSSFDTNTNLTTYCANGTWHSRYFHSEESIQQHLISSGLLVKHVLSYKEQLCSDFQRMIPSKHVDALIEVLATKK